MVAARYLRAGIDASYAAVIGPFSSDKAAKAADTFRRSRTPLILPMATSTELQRMYANTGNIWNMVQSDISQCELMLLQARIYGKSQVSLLAPASEYGRSFSDWFPFQACEAGLKINRVAIYHDETELREALKEMALDTRQYDKALLFIPDNDTYALAFDDELCRMQGDNHWLDFPQIICSDNMYSKSLENKLRYSFYEGLAPSASPQSGFIEAYLARFGEYPVPGEAQFFDALTMIAFAATRSGVTGETINAVLEYVSADGGPRTTSLLQAWEHRNSNLQDFDIEQPDFYYPALAERWAVVIAGSSDWDRRYFPPDEAKCGLQENILCP